MNIPEPSDRQWNFSEMASLTDVVWQTLPFASRRKHAAPILQSSTPFGVAIRATALSLVLATGPWFYTAIQNYRVEQPASVAQSVHRAAPPLADMFQGRFDADWTPEIERAHASKLDAYRLIGTQVSPEDEAVEVAYFNQAEDPGDLTSGMSREEIRQLLRQRRRSS